MRERERDREREREIYIYTYKICRRVSFGITFSISRVRNSTTFKKKFTAATSKSRARNRTTGELETIPPQRSFFDPLGGTVPNS